MTKKDLIKFCSQQGINVSGIAYEAGISRSHMNLILNGDMMLSKKMINKLLPVMEKYGYSEFKHGSVA